MILIAGDSWGSGVWNRGDLRTKEGQPLILHKGLEQFIVDNTDYNVKNLSRGGSSNLKIANSLRIFLEHYPQENIEKIIVFQTEYTRDLDQIFDEDFKKIETPWSLSGTFIARFYSRLSEIAKIASCPVYVVGGCSDTLWFTDEALYPGVKFICQSVTNLLINNNHRVNNPVLSLYNKDNSWIVEKIKKSVKPEFLDDFIKEIDKSFERTIAWSDHPEYFWPDGVHPNKNGHQKLFDFLVDQNIF